MASTTMRTSETLNRTFREKVQKSSDHEIHFTRLKRSRRSFRFSRRKKRNYPLHWSLILRMKRRTETTNSSNCMMISMTTRTPTILEDILKRFTKISSMSPTQPRTRVALAPSCLRRSMPCTWKVTHSGWEYSPDMWRPPITLWRPRQVTRSGTGRARSVGSTTT